VQDLFYVYLHLLMKKIINSFMNVKGEVDYGDDFLLLIKKIRSLIGSDIILLKDDNKRKLDIVNNSFKSNLKKKFVKTKDNRVCFNCNRPGHIARFCKFKKESVYYSKNK
jgi:hypothetical protein